MSDPPFSAVCLQVTPYQQNCTLIWCPETRKGAVIDPGGEVERIEGAAAQYGVTVEQILLTHGHWDHAGGAARLARETGASIVGPHRDDDFLLSRLDRSRSMPGFEQAEPCKPDRFLDDADTVNVGKAIFEVLHTPGHTPGHVVFFCRAAKFAFVGDTLFKGSVGRTDLTGGDSQALICSIRTKLWPLGDDVGFLPGHGPGSRIGIERHTNPYVRDGA